jgi:hypothetical protein
MEITRQRQQEKFSEGFNSAKLLNRKGDVDGRPLSVKARFALLARS